MAMVVPSTSRLNDHDQTVQADQSPAHVMELLEEHVPISLLLDLVAPAGPDSQDILETEGAPEQAWWLQS
jgi:hypothetical protein